MSIVHAGTLDIFDGVMLEDGRHIWATLEPTRHAKHTHVYESIAFGGQFRAVAAARTVRNNLPRCRRTEVA